MNVFMWEGITNDCVSHEVYNEYVCTLAIGIQIYSRAKLQCCGSKDVGMHLPQERSSAGSQSSPHILPKKKTTLQNGSPSEEVVLICTSTAMPDPLLDFLQIKYVWYPVGRGGDVHQIPALCGYALTEWAVR